MLVDEQHPTTTGCDDVAVTTYLSVHDGSLPDMKAREGEQLLQMLLVAAMILARAGILHRSCFEPLLPGHNYLAIRKGCVVYLQS